MLIAAATNAFTGELMYGLAPLIALIGSAIGIGSYFATRRELDKLETRVTHLEEKLSGRVGKLHARINRLLAGQMIIAGKLGVTVEHMKDIESELAEIEELEREEDEA
jgi:hypothetical protein